MKRFEGRWNLNWTLEVRQGVVRSSEPGGVRAQLEGRSQHWKKPGSGGMTAAKQERITEEDEEGKPGSSLEGSKSQAEELDSVLPAALAAGDYWKFLSREGTAESLVWGKPDDMQRRGRPGTAAPI